MYRSETLSEEKNRIAVAIASASDINRQKRALDLAFSNEVRDQDLMYFIIPIGLANKTLAWQTFQDKKVVLKEKFQGGHIIRRLVGAVTENFASEQKAQEVAKFFQDFKIPGTERAVDQTLEKIRINAAWLARDSDSIKAYLS